MKVKRLYKRISRKKKAGWLLAGALVAAYVCCLPRELFDVPYATVVTDRNGELLGARIATDGQWRFPPAGRAPEKFAACVIAYEDRTFRWHWGVNPWALIRAGMRYMRRGRVKGGGSTLTMQTIRLSRRQGRTVWEKTVEIILATRLEFRCSKDRILALYASHAPFGGNVAGVEAAAWRYFGHEAGQLSWAEAAMLAVLPNAPSAIHPGKNRDRLLEKRNGLLRVMYGRGLIGATDYALALEEALPSEPLPLPQPAPHLTEFFHRKNPGRLTVSSIGKELQWQLEEALERWQGEFLRSDVRDVAAVVVDVRRNEVAAYCGNAGFMSQRNGCQVDIVRSSRSTGSILKPLLFCAALQEGEILPETLLPDVPLNINGFMPQNFNRRYDGAAPAAKAVARSLNVPAVWLLRRYGVPKFYDFLKAMGFSTLRRPAGHYGLSLILGGAEATLWDVTCAYADMARSAEGLSRTACSMTADGGEPAGAILPEVLQRGSAWLTLEAIRDVNRPEEIDWRRISSMQAVAWKTGTSFGFRDAWAVGVTPRYAVGVWVGNASGEGRAGLMGALTAGPVMFDVFNLLPASPWFTCPQDGLMEVEVCRQSGHLRGRWCEETKPVLVSPAGLRTEACPHHIPVTLTADGRFRVYAHCVGSEGAVQRTWFVLPPAWEWFYRPHHPEYRPLPSFLPGCGGDAGTPMQFIYPQDNAHVSLPRQLDGTPGEITLELAHSRNDATVFWHVNEEYVTETRHFHQLTIPLPSGYHDVTVVDAEGNTLSVSLTVD